MSVSRQVAKAIARDAVQLEAKNQKILTSNLLAARQKLLENPDKWQHHTFGDLLDETMAEYESAVIEEFPIEEMIRHGQKEGQLFAGMDLGAAKGANFWRWTPVLPSYAIAMAESEFANTIIKATTDFKTTALRTVQQGLAMGSGTQGMMDDLLGVGLPGAKGKDGKFRQAVNRAEAISRTVSNDLINRGAMITYGQIDRISPELGLQKIWQTLSDNRTSERCLSLSGQKRELNEDFQAGDGWTGQNPPAHPYCRSRVTSRAANKNYNKDIDERFAKMPVAPIVEPEPEPAPELLAEPLSEPLPTPKKAKKATTPKTPKVPVVKEDVIEPAPKLPKEKKQSKKSPVVKSRNPALKDSVISFDIESEKKNLATMKTSDTGFGDPKYDVKNFVEYNRAKILAKANDPDGIPPKKKDIENAISMGLVPHDSLLKTVKLTKAQEKLLTENKSKLAVAKKQIEEAEKIIDKKSVKDPSKWKATMTPEEADEYFGEDNFFGQQSFWHGNSKKVTESIRTEGGQPDKNVRGAYGKGVYAGASKGIGLTYGNPNTHDESELLEMRIFSKKPYIVDSGVMSDLMDDMEVRGYGNDVRVLLKSKGFDSIYVKDTGYIVAFDKEQMVVIDHVKLDKKMASADTFREAEKTITSKFQSDLERADESEINIVEEYVNLQEEDDDDFF